ncbi:uncharacterized protein LOC128958255 [Oppia nitens]|uniref:uncharacterized protein LOC128958255 n=1 Tax=Oppia nitens TaxID=1686743 RepID=UPI0023DA4FD4|nr:uncharacterized protein LOC128958255 [Oppia nitens]
MTKKSSSDEDLNDRKDINDINKDRAKRIVGLTKDPNSCPICLQPVSNRSLTDTCLHEFCYECIHEWSADHNRCPVCRLSYRNIIHNVVSANKYDCETVPDTVAELNDEEEDNEEEEDNDEEISETIAALLQQIHLLHCVYSVRNQNIQQRNKAINDLNAINNEIIGVDDSKRQSDLPFIEEFEDIVDYNETDESVNSDLHEEDYNCDYQLQQYIQVCRQRRDHITSELHYSVQQRDRAINQLNAITNEINGMADSKTHQSRERCNKLREMSADLHKTIDELNTDLNSFSGIDYTNHLQLLDQWLNSRDSDIPLNIDFIDIKDLFVQTIGSHESSPSSLESVKSNSHEDDNDCGNESGDECEDHGCHESYRKRQQTDNSNDNDNSFGGQSDIKRIRKE